MRCAHCCRIRQEVNDAHALQHCLYESPARPSNSTTRHSKRTKGKCDFCACCTIRKRIQAQCIGMHCTALARKGVRSAAHRGRSAPIRYYSPPQCTAEVYALSAVAAGCRRALCLGTALLWEPRPVGSCWQLVLALPTYCGVLHSSTASRLSCQLFSGKLFVSGRGTAR